MNRRVLLLSLLALLQPACSGLNSLRQTMNETRNLLDEAERDGARICAPRELAIARANLRFAEEELDQGDLPRAREHVAIADPNARAARALSDANRCGPGAAQNANEPTIIEGSSDAPQNPGRTEPPADTNDPAIEPRQPSETDVPVEAGPNVESPTGTEPHAPQAPHVPSAPIALPPNVAPEPVPIAPPDPAPFPSPEPVPFPNPAPEPLEP